MSLLNGRQPFVSMESFINDWTTLFLRDSKLGDQSFEKKAWERSNRHKSNRTSSDTTEIEEAGI